MKVRVGGTPVQSLETRFAHQDHAQALRELRAHRSKCVQCGRARHKRDEQPCAEGLMLREAEQELQRKAREADRLDAMPHPDQGVLFGPAPAVAQPKQEHGRTVCTRCGQQGHPREECPL